MLGAAIRSQRAGPLEVGGGPADCSPTYRDAGVTDTAVGLHRAFARRSRAANELPSQLEGHRAPSRPRRQRPREDGGSRSVVGLSSSGEQAYWRLSPDYLFLLITSTFPISPPPSLLVAASRPVPPVVTMTFSRADRCIDRNDHGRLRGRVIPVERRQPFGRGRYCREGLRPRLHLEDPGPGQRRAHDWRLLHQRRPGRRTARPMVGTWSLGPRLRRWPCRRTRAL